MRKVGTAPTKVYEREEKFQSTTKSNHARMSGQYEKKMVLAVRRKGICSIKQLPRELLTS